MMSRELLEALDGLGARETLLIRKEAGYVSVIRRMAVSGSTRECERVFTFEAAESSNGDLLAYSIEKLGDQIRSTAT